MMPRRQHRGPQPVQSGLDRQLLGTQTIAMKTNYTVNALNSIQRLLFLFVVVKVIAALVG